MSQSSQNAGKPLVKGANRFIQGFLVVVHVLGLSALAFPSWEGLVSLIVLYILSALGITLGFHRYFTHRSFNAPRWLEKIMALMGTLALQGTIAEWVAHHRMHHAGSDTHGDPHNARRGFWFSHMGWMLVETPQFDSPRNINRFSRDINRDPFLSLLCEPWAVIGLQIIVGLALWALLGFSAMMWGIWLRLMLVYHATWFVNSAAHMFGYKTYPVDDLATNNWWVAILALGEGWHNNHHAYADSARHGHLWFEFDFTWQIIKIFRFFGLASDIKLADSLKKADPKLESVVT